MALAKQLHIIQEKGEYVYKRPKAPPSILFNLNESRKLDTEQVLNLAVEGLEHLKSIDQRFCRFEHSIFSTLHVIDRNLENEENNMDVDKEIKEFCLLASPYFLLRATHKCLEWLIRGLEAGKRNVDELITLALPFHSTAHFVRLLNVCELESTQWSFLKKLSCDQPVQRSTLINHAPLWFYRFITISAKSCAERSVRASSFFSFWAVCMREKLQTSKFSLHDEGLIMKKVLMDTLQGILMRQGDWHSLLEYRSACVVVLATFFQYFENLRPDIVSLCVDSLCQSIESVHHLQEITGLSNNAETNMFHQLELSLLRCLMLLYNTHRLEQKEQEWNAFTAINLSRLYHLRSTGNMLCELLMEEESSQICSFITAIYSSLIREAVKKEEFLELVQDIISILPMEQFLSVFSFQLLIAFDKELQVVKISTDNANVNTNSGDDSTDILHRLERLMHKLKNIGYSQQLDKGIHEYFVESMDSKAREQIGKVLISVFSGTLMVPITCNSEGYGRETDMETLSSALDHPEEKFREEALKQIQNMLDKERNHSIRDEQGEITNTEKLSQVLIHRIDLDDSFQVIKGVLDLIVSNSLFSNVTADQLSLSLENRIHRLLINEHSYGREKQVALECVSRLSCFSLQECSNFSSIVALLLSCMFPGVLAYEDQEMIFQSLMRIIPSLNEDLNDVDRETVDTCNKNDSFIFIRLWYKFLSNLSGDSSKHVQVFTLLMNVLEQLLKSVFSTRKEWNKSEWKLRFSYSQLMFSCVGMLYLLNIFQQCSDMHEYQRKLYELTRSIIQVSVIWTLSVWKHLKNKSHTKWCTKLDKEDLNDDMFIRMAFSKPNAVMLLEICLQVLKKYFKLSVANTSTILSQRTYLLSMLLWPMEAMKYKWLPYDWESIDDCITHLSNSCMKENIIHLLFDNSLRPRWIGLFSLLKETMNDLDSSVPLTVSVMWLICKEDPSYVNQYMASKVFHILRQLPEAANHPLIVTIESMLSSRDLQETKSLEMSVPFSNSDKAQLLQTCWSLKFPCCFVTKLLSSLTPTNDECCVSLELLQTVCKIWQHWYSSIESDGQCCGVSRDDFVITVSRYFTRIENQICQVDDNIWNFYIQMIEDDSHPSSQIAFLKRLCFIESCGNVERWNNLFYSLTRLISGSLDQSIAHGANILLNKLAQLHVDVFLTELDQLVHQLSQLSTEQDNFSQITFIIERSIAILGSLSSLSTTHLREDEISHMVKLLTVYLGLFSNNNSWWLSLEKDDSEDASSSLVYIEGLVISILYRFCKQLEKKFPIGSLNFRVFLQKDRLQSSVSQTAIIRLLSLLAEYFPTMMKRDFISALKWILSSTSRECVTQNIVFIKPALVAILQDEGDDPFVIRFMSELLTKLDNVVCHQFTGEMLDALGRYPLEKILVSYLMRETEEKWRQEMMTADTSHYASLLLCFPWDLQLEVIEKYMKQSSKKYKQSPFVLNLMRQILSTTAFKKWCYENNVTNMTIDESCVTTCVSLLITLCMEFAKEATLLEHHHTFALLFSQFPWFICAKAMEILLDKSSSSLKCICLTSISVLLSDEHDEWSDSTFSYLPVLKVKQELINCLLPKLLEMILSQQESGQVRIAALGSLDAAVNTCLSHQKLLSMLPTAMDAIIALCKDKRRTLACSSILCIISILNKLRISCVEYIPKLLELIQVVFDRSYKMINQRKVSSKDQIYIDTALLLIHKFHEHFSKFWTVSTLSALMKRVVERQVENVLGQLIQEVITSVPAPTAMETFHSVARETQLSSSRGIFIIGCLDKWLENISNKELRARQHDVFVLMLQMLDIRKQSVEMGILQNQKEREELEKLETEVGKLVVKQALRSMESDFKVLFVRLIGWCDEQFSSSEVLMIPSRNSQMCPFHSCLERLAPFLKVACLLADGLHELFVPYFSYIVDWCLWIASRKTLMEDSVKTSDGWKVFSKRKRELVTANDRQVACHYQVLQVTVMTQALHAIRLYSRWLQEVFTQVLFESILHSIDCRLQSDAILVDVDELASLVACFAEKLVIDIGKENGNSTEKVDLDRRLASLNRLLFLKCREKNVKVKQMAMRCVEQMIRGLGHSFLPLLPETLPLLAECLEDEVIEKNALALVQFLEDLSGEPIQKYLLK